MLREEPIGFLVAAVRRRIKQAVDARVRRRRLSPQQFWLLVAICEAGAVSLRELAQRQRIDSPMASRVITALARRGLVRVEADPSDRRRGRIELTPKGRRLGRQMVALAAELRAAIVAGFSPADQRRARALLRRILDNLDRFDPRAGARG